MVKVQEWLEENYPLAGTCLRKNERDDLNNYGKTRNEIIQLSISWQNLTGELDLTTFPNLEKLDLPSNQLTKLRLLSNNQINSIWASSNPFTTFDYSQFNPDTLSELILSGNNLETTNLIAFSHLVNLGWVLINNTQIKGSLIALKKMSRLWWLDISDTNINDGVEYLPVSIHTLFYSTDQRPNCKLKEIVEELDEFKSNRINYLHKKVKEIAEEKQAKITELEEAISALKSEKENLENKLEEEKRQKQLAIDEIKKENKKHITKLTEEFEDVSSKLLEIKKKRIRKNSGRDKK